MGDNGLEAFGRTYQYVAVVQLEDGVHVGVVAYQSVGYGIVYDGALPVCHLDAGDAVAGANPHLLVIVFYDGAHQVGGKPVLLVDEMDGVVLLVPDAESVRMSYPDKPAAVFVDGQHIALLETAGTRVDVVCLGFGVDDNQSAVGSYVEVAVVVVVHIAHEELFGAVEDGVELPGVGVQALDVAPHGAYPHVAVLVYLDGVDVVFEQLAVGGGVLPDLPFGVAE